jgi:hypothetical protein
MVEEGLQTGVTPGAIAVYRRIGTAKSQTKMQMAPLLGGAMIAFDGATAA